MFFTLVIQVSVESTHCWNQHWIIRSVFIMQIPGQTVEVSARLICLEAVWCTPGSLEGLAVIWRKQDQKHDYWAWFSVSRACLCQAALCSANSLLISLWTCIDFLADCISSSHKRNCVCSTANANPQLGFSWRLLLRVQCKNSNTSVSVHGLAKWTFTLKRCQRCYQLAQRALVSLIFALLITVFSNLWYIRETILKV